MNNYKLLSCIGILVLSGCGGGGGDEQSTTPEPTNPPVQQIDHPLQGAKLRHYELGDYISYTFNYDQTYEDGSGQYWKDGKLDWTIETDPIEVAFDNGKSLIAAYKSDMDGGVEQPLTERFIQVSRTDYPEVSGGFHLISDKDTVVVDALSGDDLKCIAYSISENTCYPVAMSPSEFKVGYNWEYQGKSDRRVTAFLTNPENFYDSIVKWNVVSKEVINTNLGSFETYKVKMYRELSYLGAVGKVYYLTEGFYWYYPKIGVVKADFVKSQKFSGSDKPYVTNKIDYTISYTNIPF